MHYRLHPPGGRTNVAREFIPWRKWPPFIFPPGGRTLVAREFIPWNNGAHPPHSIFRP
jgi:hypothetical protein